MSEAGAVSKVDAAIADFFAAGNGITVLLAGILVIILLWPILMGKDPDLHPFLLVRQSQASPVRQPGESAVYRANEIPYGYPLRKGLAVKDAGAPAWHPGRDGDLRDVWRKAVTGATDEKGNSLGQKGKFLTIHGRENVVEQNFSDVTRAINAIGGFVRQKGGKTVAVSLSNSVELLATVFASAFYGFKPVLLPYGIDQDQVQTLIAKTSADVLIAEAGTIELESALSAAPGLKNIIWVVKQGSQHIDWTEKPDGVGQINLVTWHDTVKTQAASSEVLESEKDSKTGPIATFWKGTGGQFELIEYTSETIVAGIGGLLSTLLRDHKLTSKDILLPIASLTESYALCWTMAALYMNASVALNSVAGDSVDLTVAAVGASPTIIVASSGTITKLHELVASVAPGLIQKISNYFTKQDMRSGYMSTKKSASITPYLSALRVLLISQRDSDNTKISSSILSVLRLALGTRIAYALTTGPVAGAVTQTNILDYREKGTTVSVGVPVTSLELLVVGDDEKLDQDMPEGKIVVKGPAVVGGKAQLDVTARVDLDRTVTLL